MDSSLFSKHPEWPAVRFVLDSLHAKGHKAVLAGGCVRDALLGKLAKDLDVATDATPEEVESYFSRVLPLGKSFGVCRVIHDGASIEVATFRQEFDYRDGRRPSQVEYSTLEKDAERRDFTVNALFFDIQTEQVIDHVGGTKDLQQKIIRAVGDPDKRMNEDYLRILRGIRFAGHLGFSIEEKTKKSFAQLAMYLPRISQERIYDEFNKMFGSQGISRCMDLMFDLHFEKHLFPDWNFSEELNLIEGKKSVQMAFQSVAQNLPVNALWGWMVLYHFRAQKLSARAVDKEFLDLKLPRATIDKCRAIFDAKVLLEQKEDELLLTFVSVKTAGALEEAMAYWDSFGGQGTFLKIVKDLENRFCVNGLLPQPLVSGTDLMKKGISQGPEIKKYLELSYLTQLKNKATSKEELLRLVLGARGLA